MQQSTQSIHPFLRSYKARQLEKMKENLTGKTSLSVKEYNKIALEPLYQQVNSPTSENLIYDDAGFCSKIINKNTSSKKYFSGVSLYGGYFRKVWGHFLFGTLGRLWPLTDKDFLSKIDNIVFFISKSERMKLDGNYLEIMQLLGIDNKIVIVENEIVEFEKLLIPDISFEHDSFNSKQCCNLFDYIIEKVLEEHTVGNLSRKIFFTRTKLKNASSNEINLSVFNDFFRNNGYEIISPESLSIKELIKLLAETKKFVSISGSCAHNIVFATKNVNREVIIIERHAWNNTFQANINMMRDINAIHVDAHWMPKLSSSSGPVFLYGPTPQFMKFVQHYGLKNTVFPESEKSKRNGLRKYLTRYRRYFGHAEKVGFWEIDSAKNMVEAIIETRNYYSTWLINKQPIVWYDYLSPRFYIRLIKKLKQ